LDGKSPASEEDIMKQRIKFYLTIAGIIVMFDAVASAASRTLLLDYTKLAWASYIFYVAVGYLGCKYFDLPSGIAAGLVAGLFDSTLGWFLSSTIEPYIPFAQPHYTPLLVSVVIIMVSLTGALFGLVGALLSRMVNRGSQSADA
jgi:hypothetical protein